MEDKSHIQPSKSPLASFGAQFANFILNSEDDFAKSIREQIRGEESQTSASTGQSGKSLRDLGWVDNKDAMALLGVSKHKLQDLRDCGMLKYAPIGRKFFYKTEDIVGLLETMYEANNKDKVSHINNKEYGKR